MKEWALVYFLCQPGNFSNCVEDLAQAPEQFESIEQCAPKMYTRPHGAFVEVALCKHQGDENDVDYEEIGDHA